jgi:pyrroloquinoline quinone biosynthesis protein D
MHEPTEQEGLLRPEIRPKLAARARLQIDRVSQQPVVLYPEGVLLLNETGTAILTLCDGQRTLSEIVAELAGRYQATPEEVQQDLCDYLLSLYQRNLLELLQ